MTKKPKLHVPKSSANGNLKFRPNAPKPSKMSLEQRKALSLKLAVESRALETVEQAALAGKMLSWASVNRDTFEALWAELDVNDREELAAWISLELDGDEGDANEDD